MVNYSWLKDKLAKGLRFNQEVYEEAVAGVVDGTTVWLDAGCGRHLLPAWREDTERMLVARAAVVIGCDVDDVSLRTHRTISRLVVADLTQLPFKMGSVTLVTANMVVEHLESPVSVFAEFARVLTPGGRVIVHTPNAHSYFVVASRWLPRTWRLRLVRRLDTRMPDAVFPAYYRANTIRKLRQLMTQVGLVEERCRMVASDAVLAGLPLLAAIELLYIRLTLWPAFRWMRVTILATFARPQGADVGSERVRSVDSALSNRAGKERGRDEREAAGKPVRTQVRDSALQVIRLAGGLNAVSRSRWRSRRLLILCYHGFAQDDEHRWDPALYVTRDHLESRLKFLAAEGYAVVPLAEGLARLRAGTLPPRAVAITVDDGTYDFYAIAYPVLKRLGVPVTVFVSTYYVVDRRPVFDGACQYLLWKAWTSGKVDLKDPLDDGAPLLRTAVDCGAAAVRVREIARRERWSAERKHEWLERFARRLGLDWEDFLRRRLVALMHPEEIGALDPAIADVQLHTHRHRAPEQRELFLREIADNRRALSECGVDARRLTHFCYPSGIHLPAFLPWLAEAGVTSAVTTVPGVASKRDDALLLPRFIDATTTSEVEFEGWASGLRHFLRRPS
jgi:peptidoglycan/xylan/chitin deacetylase (PgdA/CDA1 family)/SAM-dependent methyltransferase